MKHGYWKRTRGGLTAGLSLFAIAIAVPSPVASQVPVPDSLPPGVTAAMVEEGAVLFSSLGLCMACHGLDAKGLTAPDLTDDVWHHSDGSFDAIVQQILEGVPIEESETGIPMLPKGGSQLTDDQVRSVAAYVWSLSHK